MEVFNYSMCCNVYKSAFLIIWFCIVSCSKVYSLLFLYFCSAKMLKYLKNMILWNYNITDINVNVKPKKISNFKKEKNVGLSFGLSFELPQKHIKLRSYQVLVSPNVVVLLQSKIPLNMT